MGRALKFYASVRIEIRKTEAIKQGDIQIGHKVRCSVKKNKVAPPFRIAEYDVIYGSGIDRIEETATVAIEENIVKSAGAWVSMLNENGESMYRWNGRNKFKEALATDPKLYEQIRSIIVSKIISNTANIVSDNEEIEEEEEIDE